MWKVMNSAQTVIPLISHCYLKWKFHLVRIYLPVKMTWWRSPLMLKAAYLWQLISWPPRVAHWIFRMLPVMFNLLWMAPDQPSMSFQASRHLCRLVWSLAMNSYWLRFFRTTSILSLSLSVRATVYGLIINGSMLRASLPMLIWQLMGVIALWHLLSWQLMSSTSMHNQLHATWKI